jgi:hypothetical protein
MPDEKAGSWYPSQRENEEGPGPTRSRADRPYCITDTRILIWVRSTKSERLEDEELSEGLAGAECLAGGLCSRLGERGVIATPEWESGHTAPMPRVG